MFRRIHPDTLRYALLALNTLLMVFVLWCAVYAFHYNNAIGVFLNDESWYNPLKGFTPVKELAAYRVAEATGAGAVGNRPQRISGCFDKRAPRPVPEPTEAEEPEETQQKQLQEGGPLAEKWELVMTMVMPGRAQKYALLGEATDDPRSRRRTYSRRSRSGRRNSSRNRRSTVRRGTEQKMLRVYDPEVNPEPTKVGTNWYFLADLQEKPCRIVYVKAGYDPELNGWTVGETQYYMTKEEESRNPLDMGPSGEEPGGSSPSNKKNEVEPDDRGSISLGGRQLGSEGGRSHRITSRKILRPGGSGSNPGGSSKRKSSRRKPPSAEDIKKLRGALKKAGDKISEEKKRRLNRIIPKAKGTNQ